MLIGAVVPAYRLANSTQTPSPNYGSNVLNASGSSNTPSSPSLENPLYPGKANLVATINVMNLPNAGGSPGPAEHIPTLTRVGPLLAYGSPSQESSKTSTTTRITPDTIAGTSNSNVTISSSFNAMNQIGSCSCIPPDVQLATGPNHIVEMVNLAGAIYTKQGTLVKSFELATFFNAGFDFISDPKILYDASTGVWFASLIDTQQSMLNPSNLTIATSATSDPTGVWRIYKIVKAPYLTDQPIIGVSDDKFVLSANDFAQVGNTFVYSGAQYWVLNKFQLIEGFPAVDFATFGPDINLISVHPAQSLSSTTTEWMASNLFNQATQYFYNNSIDIISLSGTPPNVTPSITNIPLSIGTFANGTIPGGAQPGTSTKVANNDIRILDAAWFQGKLWFTLNDACKPTGDTQLRACFHMTQIDTTTISVKQDFDVGTAGQYFYFPALRIDALGDLDIIYGYSSSSAVGGTDIYPSLAVAGQAVSDPIDTLTSPKTLVAGNSNDTSTRYGDYFGASVDPSNPSIVWVAGEYHNITIGRRFFIEGSGSYNNWSTYIGSIRVTRTNSPSTPITVTDFGVSGPQTTFALAQGTQTTITIGITSLNFAGTVTLTTSSTPTGPTVSANPSSVTLSAGGTASSTLSFSTTMTGIYSVALTGTSGSLSHNFFATFIVTPIVFTINQNTNFTGVNVKTTGSVSIDYPSNAFTLSGSASVVATNSTTQATLYSSTTPITKLPFTLNSTGFYQSQFLLDVAVSPYHLSTNVWVAYPQSTSGPGHNATITSLTRNLDIDLNGTVDLTDEIILENSIGCSIGQTCYNPQADINADGTVDFTDDGILMTFIGAPDYFKPVPSFSLAGTTQLISFQTGRSTNSTVTVTSLNDFSGTVTISAKVSPVITNGPTVAMNPASISILSGGFQQSTLQISSSSSTPGGIYVVNVTATSGSQSQSVFYAVAATPVSLTINTSTTIDGLITTGSGTLSIDTGSANPFTISGAITVTAKNASTQALVFTYTYNVANVPLRQFGSIAPGTSNAPSFAFVRVIFFDIPSSPYHHMIQAITQWDGPESTHLVAPFVSQGGGRNPDWDLNGIFDVNDYYIIFNGLGCQIGTPCYDPRADIGATGLPGFAILNFIQYNEGSIVLMPFTTTANPSTVSFTLAGPSANSTITITNLSGSFGGVSLAVTVSPSGPVTSLWPYTLTPPAFGSSTSALSISADAATPGTYTVTVTSNGDYQTETATVTVTVAGDFSVSSNPSNIIIQVGSSGTSTITATSVNGFSGYVAYYPFANVNIVATAVNDSSCRAFGLTINQPLPLNFQTSLPSSVIGTSCNGQFSFSELFGISNNPPSFNYVEFGVNATTGHWRANISVNLVSLANVNTDYSHHVHASFQTGIVTGPLSTSYGGPVNVPAGGSQPMTFTVYTTSSTPVGNYTFYLTGTSGGLTHTITVTAQVVDFTINASSPSPVDIGSSATSTITITALNHFPGTVSLSDSVPSGLSCGAISPGSVTGSGTATVSCSSTVAGNYTLTITGNSGSLSHSTSVTFRFQDYTLSANPTSLTIKHGSSGNSTITLTSLNGFSGTVALNATITPVVSHGPTAKLSPPTVTLTPNNSGGSTLTIATSPTTPKQTYTITLTATSGNLVHTVTINLTVT